MAGVIVWLYLNDRGMWNLYEPDISCEIERGHQSGLQKLRLASTNSKAGSASASNYEIDFAAMMQTQIQSGFQRPVHRSIVPPASLLHQGFVWEFEGDQPGEWKTYDLQTIELIESVSANPQNGPILDLRKTFFKLPYIIDPKNGTQTRIDTGTVRRIQRRPLTQKYTSVAATSLALIAGPSSATANPGANSSGVPMKSSLQQNKKRAHPYSKATPPSRTTSQGFLTNGYTTSTLPNAYATAQSQAQLQQMTQTTPGPLTRRQLQKSTSSSGAQQQQHQQTPLQKQQQLYQHPYPQMYPSPYTVSYPPHLQANTAPLGLLPGPQAVYAGIHSQQPQQVTHLTSSSISSSTSVTPPTEALPSVKKITISKTNKKTKPKTGIEVLAKYMDSITQHLDTDDCCICFEKLSEASSYGEGTADAHEAVKLSRCSHHFHKLCLLEMYKCSHKGDSLQCPSCNTIYGEKNGDCPPGFMEWKIIENSSLLGYEGYNTIQVIYHIKPGVQGPEHASPGKPFNARGFPRQGFLPDCDKGRKILKLFIEAFRRRLMFTIGTSTTTGERDTVTWNEIHHKTEPHGNYTGHGYPDPNYLDNVLLELASHGVTA